MPLSKMASIISLPHKGILFPFYHIISEETPIHIKHLYKAKTPKEFRADLDFLTKNYEVWSWKECKEYLESNTTKQANAVHLSFDDGLRECYQIIAPLLEEYRIKASFFINSSFVDNHALMYRYKESVLVENLSNSTPYTAEDILDIPYSMQAQLDAIAQELAVNFNEYLQENKPYMSTFQIKELYKAGHNLGGHSVDHPYYFELPLHQQLEQTVESIDFIQNLVDSEDSLFAFPFTDYGVKEDFFKKMETKVDYTFSTAGIKNDTFSWSINRFSAEGKALKSIIKKEKMKFAIRQIFKIRNVNTHSFE